MKYILLFLLSVLIGFTSFVIYRKYSVSHIKTPPYRAKPFSLDVPPAKSLKGQIESMTGDIEWQSRSATEPAKLTQKKPVLQGEEFWTKEDGTLNIRFENVVEITADANTHLNIVQTLPMNFVVLQDSGAAAYKKSPAAAPTSIRTLHVLTQLNDGEADVEVDDTAITLTVKTGSVTVAYNDKKNISRVVTINGGNTYTFDDKTRKGETKPIDE